MPDPAAAYEERTEREREEIMYVHLHVYYMYITYIGVATSLSFKD